MPAWMTSLLREEVPLPMWPSASVTMTSWPLSAACRAIARPTTPAPTTSICIISPLRQAVGRQALHGVAVDGLDDGVVHWVCCGRRETDHVAVHRRPFNSCGGLNSPRCRPIRRPYLLEGPPPPRPPPAIDAGRDGILARTDEREGRWPDIHNSRTSCTARGGRMRRNPSCSASLPAKSPSRRSLD